MSHPRFGLSEVEFHLGLPPQSWLDSATSVELEVCATRTWQAAVGLLRNRSMLESQEDKFMAMVSYVVVSSCPASANKRCLTLDASRSTPS